MKTFDPTKESCRVVSHYGTRNERQITEDRQRDEEAAARAISAGQSHRDPTESKR